MTATALVAAVIALAGSIAALVYLARRALNAGDATIDAVRILAIRDGEALRYKYAADTADSLRAASEERVRRLTIVARERLADAVQDHPLVFADRAAAVEYANRLLTPQADLPDIGADRGDAGRADGLPDQPTARLARGAVPGVP
jgi:hypothetical protein